MRTPNHRTKRMSATSSPAACAQSGSCRNDRAPQLPPQLPQPPLQRPQPTQQTTQPPPLLPSAASLQFARTGQPRLAALRDAFTASAAALNTATGVALVNAVALFAFGMQFKYGLIGLGQHVERGLKGMGAALGQHMERGLKGLGSELGQHMEGGLKGMGSELGQHVERGWVDSAALVVNSASQGAKLVGRVLMLDRACRGTPRGRPPA